MKNVIELWGRLVLYAVGMYVIILMDMWIVAEFFSIMALMLWMMIPVWELLQKEKEVKK